MSDLFIGLMSGTSLDGVDGVLADFSCTPPAVAHHTSAPFSAALHDELLSLNSAGDNELHRAALAANAVMRVYAGVVRELLRSAALEAGSVAAIGAHGQTVRHRPQEFDGTGFTLQLANPSLLAELTGIDIVADFRSRDVAAGGQGAPLAPFFHQSWFGGQGQATAVLNIGGISNVTLLRPDGTVKGFDCGPGNALMDFLAVKHLSQPYDALGAWAATGRVDEHLLHSMLQDPYFAKSPPKSTGRDLFNIQWLDDITRGHAIAPADLQATLAELTARACANDLMREQSYTAELVVCGGGALNDHLMRRLQARLPGIRVVSSAERGLPPLQVEAAAFAWLARKCLRREKLALESTTGARGARVLGCIYPR
ncbi:MAG: anhydro-N-acetylmuramic acid kinase [Ramlibacter sp.]|nr:anhydro-N-acetylmuramic acid kinase [Ramlibacter sp.]